MESDYSIAVLKTRRQRSITFKIHREDDWQYNPLYPIILSVGRDIGIQTFQDINQVKKQVFMRLFPGNNLIIEKMGDVNQDMEMQGQEIKVNFEMNFQNMAKRNS